MKMGELCVRGQIFSSDRTRFTAPNRPLLRFTRLNWHPPQLHITTAEVAHLMEERMSVREYLKKSPLGFGDPPSGNRKEAPDWRDGGRGNLARSIGRDIPSPLHFWLKRKNYEPIGLSKVCKPTRRTYLQPVHDCSRLFAPALIVEPLAADGCPRSAGATVICGTFERIHTCGA